jgi:hypothetical protein
VHEAVDLSPSTFMKYQALEAKKLRKEIKTEEKKNEVNGHGCSFEFDESEFFDAYENLPIYREEFFDCLEKFESENMILGQDTIFWISMVLIAIAS